MEWELLDISGPVSAYSVHLPSESLAFSIDSIILVWDPKTSDKRMIRCHERTVKIIEYSSDWKLMFCVDTSGLISVWEWQDLEYISTIKTERNSFEHFLDIKGSFDDGKLVLCKFKDYSKYKLSIFYWNDQDLVLHESSENSGCVSNIKIKGEYIVTSENSVINLLDDHLNWVKRIESESVVKDISVNNEQIYVLNSSFIVLDLEGTILYKSDYEYQAISLRENLLFLLTNGQILEKDNAYSESRRKFTPSYNSKMNSFYMGNTIGFCFYEDSSVIAFDFNSHITIDQLSGHPSKVNSVIWKTKNKYISICNDSTLYKWTLSCGKWRSKKYRFDNSITSLAIHSSLRIISCGFANGFVKFISSSSINSFQYDSSTVTGLEFSNDRDLLLISHISGRVFLTNLLRKGENLELKVAASKKLKAKFAGFDKIIALNKPSTLQMFYISNFQVTNTARYRLKSHCKGFDIHQSNLYCICILKIGQICIIRLENGEVAGLVSIDYIPKNICQDPTGLYLLSIYDYSKVVVYETGTGFKTCELKCLNSVINASWSEDGRHIILSGKDGCVSVWRIPDSMLDNIFDLKDASRVEGRIWEHFPIQFSQQPRLSLQDSAISLTNKSPLKAHQEHLIS